MEPRPGGGHDVAVGLCLGDLDGLLLLQHQEAVELGGGLLPVVAPAQLQQADRVGAGLGHDALEEEREPSVSVQRQVSSLRSVPDRFIEQAPASPAVQTDSFNLN